MTNLSFRDQGLDEARRRILALAADDAVIPRNRTVLAGFSQGGAVSLFTGLQELQAEDGFAGVLSMSGYLPRPAGFEPSSTETPVLMCHGGWFVTNLYGTASLMLFRACCRSRHGGGATMGARIG